jgi:hypothetical protein
MYANRPSLREGFIQRVYSRLPSPSRRRTAALMAALVGIGSIGGEHAWRHRAMLPVTWSGGARAMTAGAALMTGGIGLRTAAGGLLLNAGRAVIDGWNLPGASRAAARRDDADAYMTPSQRSRRKFGGGNQQRDPDTHR